VTQAFGDGAYRVLCTEPTTRREHFEAGNPNVFPAQL
jgi:hypothetical protein